MDKETFDSMTNDELAYHLRAIKNKTMAEKQNLQKLEHAFRSELPKLAVGGIEDLNKVIKPFIYSTDLNVYIPPSGQTRSTFITVSQESPFIVTKLVKGVYRATPNENDSSRYDSISFVDPKDEGLNGIAPGLKFVMQDSQSKRFFFSNPIRVDHIGDVKDPYRFQSPQMIPGNNNIEFKLFNNSPDQGYIVNFTLYGYRIRVEDSRNLLSLVEA